MKILIIDGCGHKGNTWKLTQFAMEEILKIVPDVEFEEMVLSKLNLPFCIGCSNCFRVGNDKCPHFSIMGDIISKIQQADGIIMCSTTYNCGETGYIKNFFDHLSFMLHRPYFFKSKALIVTTAGGVGHANAANRIEASLTGIGCNKCYKVAIAAISWNAYILTEKAKKVVAKKTAKFTKDILSKKLHSPKFINLIPYNIMRGMGLSYTSESDYPTADGVWWTSPERKNSTYFAGIKISWTKRLFGHFFYCLGKNLGNKMKVTYKK